MNRPMPPPPHSTTLTVSDVERLAKAGIKVDLGIVYTVADVELPPPPPVWPSSLEDAFWQRWRRARPRDEYTLMRVEVAPYLIHAHDYGAKVYIMVCPPDTAPFIIEDESPLYPSDALMAKLALYERTKP